MRVLLVEDDKETARAIECMLHKYNAICHSISCGEEALQVASLYEYDAIVLDYNMPIITGLEIVRRLRLKKVYTPILIITSDQNVKDRVDVLSSGADDHMLKPFNEDEMFARLQAIVRRSQGHADPVIHVGDLSISLRERLAYAHGRKLDLTGKEYRILELLALKQGSTITKETFLNYLYGGLDEPECKIIDVFVCKLRKKLKTILGDSAVYIETVWGRGYVLRNPAMPFSSSEYFLGERKKQLHINAKGDTLDGSQDYELNNEHKGTGIYPHSKIHETEIFPSPNADYKSYTGMMRKNDGMDARDLNKRAAMQQHHHMKKPFEDGIASSNADVAIH